MAQNPIQWFPGHMAKTRRMIAENLTEVDLVLEVLDARIPRSSKNPETDGMIGDKPRIFLLSKSSLADPAETEKHVAAFRAEGRFALAVDSLTGEGIDKIGPLVRQVLKEKLDRYRERGMAGRTVRAMIIGIPNVGKSSLINRLAGGRRAKVEDRPGVTLTKQWVTTSVGIDLLDMPGVLWPKFEDRTVGENLAFTGAIRDAVLDTEEIAMLLCARLYEVAKDKFLIRYKLTPAICDGLDAYDLFEAVGRKRGFLVAGGEVDHDRLAAMLLDEFRGGVIGRITLEKV